MQAILSKQKPYGKMTPGRLIRDRRLSLFTEPAKFIIHPGVCVSVGDISFGIRLENVYPH